MVEFILERRDVSTATSYAIHRAVAAMLGSIYRSLRRSQWSPRSSFSALTVGAVMGSEIWHLEATETTGVRVTKGVSVSSPSHLLMSTQLISYNFGRL